MQRNEATVNGVRPVTLAWQETGTSVAFKGFWQIWRISGIACPRRINATLYRLYGICLGVLYLSFLLTLIVNIRYTHTLQELCDSLSIIISDIMAVLKFLNVFIHRAQIRRISAMVEELDGYVDASAQRAVMRDTVKTSQRIFRAWSWYYVMAVLSSIVRPLFTSDRMLMYPGYFNVDWHSSDFAYACIFLYQGFCLSAQTFGLCASDAYQSIYLCVLTGYMRALELRIRSIGENEEASDAASCYRELRHCIRTHIKILHLHAAIQETISYALLAQFVGTVSVQCVAALHFLYNVDDHNLSAQILSLFFFSAFTLEMFIVCYYGHYMRVQSESLLEGFYSCNWMDQQTSFRRTLIVPMIRTQIPLEIYAGNYLKVDLESFMQVMKFAYSTFTILLRMK